MAGNGLKTHWWNGGKPPRAVLDRFWEQLIEEPNTGCWIWLGIRMQSGYPYLRIGKKLVRVHRWAYEQFKGPIPHGLTLDHRCRQRTCVNPVHLEAVTMLVNRRRAMRAACKCGRAYNGVVVVDGHIKQRTCSFCRGEAVDRYRARCKAKEMI